MYLRRVDAEHMELGEMDHVCGDLLLQIVASATGGDHPAANRRLFSKPIETSDPEFEEDWKTYVEPDLRDLFRTAQEIVTGDLKEFQPAESPGSEASLVIPQKHLEAWIHTLNQARLAIAARFEFSEKEIEKPIFRAATKRAHALFQVHFYGFLQECFLQQLD